MALGLSSNPSAPTNRINNLSIDQLVHNPHKTPHQRIPAILYGH
jgi:hypothetical protein